MPCNKLGLVLSYPILPPNTTPAGVHRVLISRARKAEDKNPGPGKEYTYSFCGVVCPVSKPSAQRLSVWYELFRPFISKLPIAITPTRCAPAKSTYRQISPPTRFNFPNQRDRLVWVLGADMGFCVAFVTPKCVLAFPWVICLLLLYSYCLLGPCMRIILCYRAALQSVLTSNTNTAR